MFVIIIVRMRFQRSTVEKIAGCNIQTVVVNGVKLYHVNDYEDEESIHMFKQYLDDDRTCLFFDTLGDNYQVLHYTRSNHKRCDHLIEDDYYVSREILEDYIQWTFDYIWSKYLY